MILKKWFKQLKAGDTIGTEIWSQTLRALPFLSDLDARHLPILLNKAQEFARDKTFSGIDGFKIDDQVRAIIAVQACLPVIHLPGTPYRDFVEVIVYPDRFVAPHERVDEAGVVHETTELLSGEAMSGGPVILAWPDAAPDQGAPGFNVVIHEFAHKLDLMDGEADGIPPMSRAQRVRWEATLHDALERFRADLEAVEGRIPPHIDPESEDADPYYARLALDPYAATDSAEFFAVSVEAFFTDRRAFGRAFTDLDREMARYFQLD